MIKIITALLLASFVSIGQTTVTDTLENTSQHTSSEWKTVNESEYSINYPSAWHLDQSKQYGTSFILFSPLESDGDKFKENINLIIQDLGKSNIDLDKYAEISEEQVKTLTTNLNFMESKRVKNDNDEYHKVIYSADQGVFHLQFEQYLWVKNNKAFVLTFTSELDKFADFVEVGEKILNSFVPKK